MIGPRAQHRFLNHAVDVPEAHVVVGRQMQVGRAAFHQFGRSPLAPFEAAFDGRRALGRNDRIIAVGEHQTLVGQGYGLGPARTAFGKHGHHRHFQPGHFVNIARYLLGRAGVVLHRVAARREHIGVDGNALGFGYLHVVQGLGVAPGFGRAAVAEFLAVAFFVPDDQHRLVEDLFAPASGDIGPGYEHGRVVGVLVLTADFRVIVVHVFQNIAQTDALRVTHDAHFVHGGQPIFQLALHEKEQILQRAQSLFRVGHRAVLYAPLQFRQTLVQKADIHLVLARENIAHVVQALRPGPLARSFDGSVA